MPDPRHEFHLYENLSLSPAYVMGYAFNALERIDARTSVHGRGGALALLTELFATLTSLKLEASLLAAEPLRVQQQAMARRPRSSRLAPDSAIAIREGLSVVESCVREELRARGARARPAAPPARPTDSVRVMLGEIALEQCPEELRWEITEACRAFDAQLYTAAVFHVWRFWEGLPARGAPALGSDDLPVANPRSSCTLRSDKADALEVFATVRRKLEKLASPPDLQ